MEEKASSSDDSDSTDSGEYTEHRGLTRTDLGSDATPFNTSRSRENSPRAAAARADNSGIRLSPGRHQQWRPRSRAVSLPPASPMVIKKAEQLIITNQYQQNIIGGNDACGLDVKELSGTQTAQGQDVFVETQGFRDAVRMVRHYGVVVITGPPGSGKSSTARALLRHFRAGGFDPLFLRTVEEYRRYTRETEHKKVVLLEHFLGLGNILHNTSVQAWLDIFPLAKELWKRTENTVLTLFVIRPELVEQLKSRCRKAGTPKVFDLGDTAAFTEPEESQMIRNHMQNARETVSENDTVLEDIAVSEAEICDIRANNRTKFLFPLFCYQYATTYRNDKYGIEIFSHPSIAYVDDVINLLQTKGNNSEAIDKLADIMVQLKTLQDSLEGELPLKQLSQSRLKGLTINEVGSFILHNAASFPCRVFYDALGMVLGRCVAMPQLLRVCDTRFLVEHVQTCQDMSSCDSRVCVAKDSEDWKSFVERVFNDVLNGHLSELCQYSSLLDEDLLSDLEKLRERKSLSVRALATIVDSTYSRSLIYWSLWGQPLLRQWCLKYLHVDTLSSDLLQDIFFAVTYFDIEDFDRNSIRALFSRKQEHRTFFLPFPSAESQFRKSEMRTSYQCFTDKLLYTGSPGAEIPDSLLETQVTEDRIQLTCFCRTWYLAYRLVKDRLVDEEDEAGDTLLQLAVEADDLNLVQFLTAHGASVAPLAPGRKSCFITAVNMKHREIAEHLFQVKNDLTYLCGNADAVYSLCVHLEENAWFSTFVQQGVDQQAQKNCITLLHAAAIKGDIKTARKALRWNVAINAQAKERRDQTALHIASEKGDLDIVHLLLSEGADTTLRDTENNTVLHSACSAPTQIFWPLFLLKWKLTVKKEQIVRELLENNTDTNVINSKGQTPLLLACNRPQERGLEEIVGLLLVHGAQVNTADCEGVTALHAVVAHGHMQLVPALRRHGADINAVTRKGETPLYIASSQGHRKTVRLLLQNGARVNVAALDGLTSFDAAVSNGHSEVLAILHQYSV